MKHVLRVAVLVTLCALVVQSCGNQNQSTARTDKSADRSELPSARELAGLTPREALSVANGWKGTSGITTFVDQKEINFTLPGGKSVSVPLPENEMVVAIAPYIQTTHPCTIHYMSGCQGELVDVPFDVTATDENGNVVIDDTYTSLPNGFIELWLPRELTLAVTISGAGKSATGTIETYASSNTCITTIELT